LWYNLIIAKKESNNKGVIMYDESMSDALIDFWLRHMGNYDNDDETLAYLHYVFKENQSYLCSDSQYEYVSNILTKEYGIHFPYNRHTIVINRKEFEYPDVESVLKAGWVIDEEMLVRLKNKEDISTFLTEIENKNGGSGILFSSNPITILPDWCFESEKGAFIYGDLNDLLLAGWVFADNGGYFK
jgi:hypothetical protein